MKYLRQNKFWNITEDYNKEKLLYLLIDRPNYASTNNNFIWENNKKQWHREYDLPAYIWKHGVFLWYKNNQLHRDNNKPAVIYANGKKEYWLNGILFKTVYK